MSETKYTTSPIEFVGRAHYNILGELGLVEVSLRGRELVQRYPNPGDDEGDCFMAAFEAARNQLLTLLVMGPKPEPEQT
jgi:hypothetical protein